MRVLVTGGGGFLGSAVCRLLRARGDSVVSLARNRYPALEPLGVVQHVGDMTVLETVLTASKGCDAIVHTAAKPGAWGRLDDFYAINVGGTDNVIAACFMNGIGKLVYTSTPSVVHAGADLDGVDESVPYAAHYKAHYPKTKRIAEERVLHANGPELSTVALRPHLIFGPGDNHLLPRILARARAGRLRFIGERPVRVDVTYIDNAAQAHVDALVALGPGAACAGRPYFISNAQPILLTDMVNRLLRAAGLPPENRHLKLPIANALASVMEAVWGLLRLDSEPPLTRFVVEQLSTTHWFDIGAARRDLGYAPNVSIIEGVAKLSEWLLREKRSA